MARIKRKSELSVSLFPFLSILACVMGTLTLIIYGVALGQTLDPARGAPSAENSQHAIERIAAIKAEIERLKTLISAALERQKKVSDLKDEIARLLSTLPGSGEQIELAATLLPQYEDLVRQIQAVEEQLAGSTLELNDLQQQIKTIEEKLDATPPATPTGLTAKLVREVVSRTTNVRV